MEWLKLHWYYALGAVLGIWLVFRLLRGSSAGVNASTAVGGGGVSVVYGGTNANDAAVQVAQLNQQSDLARQQIASSQAISIATLAEHATESTNATDLEKTRVQAQYGLDVVNSNNALSLSQANLAYNLGVNTNETNLAMLENTNAAKVTALESTNQTNLAAIINTNQTNLAAYGIQAQVVNNRTNALRDTVIAVSGNQTKALQAELDAQRYQAQLAAGVAGKAIDARNAQIDQLLHSSSFNLGSQHAGANSVAALAALSNPPSAAGSAGAAAAADTVIDKPANIAAIIQAIGGTFQQVTGGLKALAA